MLKSQPACDPSRREAILSQQLQTIIRTPLEVKNSLRLPIAEVPKNFDSKGQGAFMANLSSLKGNQECQPVTPALPIKNNHRFPNSPTSSLHSQLLFPDEIQGIDASDTASVAAFLKAEDAMVIDVRPFNAYSVSRVSGAINICLPSTLLKRTSYDFAHVINATTISQSLKDSLLAQKRRFKILIYDQASETSRLSLQLYLTVMKFFEASSYTVAYLNGGFHSVEHVLRDSSLLLLLQTPTTLGPILPKGNHFSENGDSNDTLPLLTGFTLPSATKANVKLLNSIKRTTSRVDSGAKYKYDFKFPSNFASKMNKLPPWLLFVAESYGKENCSQLIVDHLSERFNRLEASEQVRLSLAINNSDGISNDGTHGSLHDSTGYGTPLELCPCCDDITYTIPKGVEYGHKNRYKNVWPYEHSRVRLKLSPSCKSGQQDDYFNANYIHFEELCNNKYIATQNPLEATFKDFWDAVWHNGVKAIVCIDNSALMHTGKYYEEDTCYTNVSVHIKLVLEHKGYTYREIVIEKQKQIRTLHHFAYTGWPDFGTPDDLNSVIDMMEFKNGVLSQTKSSMSVIQDSWDVLVHCSAGCGRTGCFITLDMVSSLFTPGPREDMLDPWGEEDLIYKSVQFQRQQRISMVQNLGQFIFCYESILNYLFDNVL